MSPHEVGDQGRRESRDTHLAMNKDTMNLGRGGGGCNEISCAIGRTVVSVTVDEVTDFSQIWKQVVRLAIPARYV